MPGQYAEQDAMRVIILEDVGETGVWTAVPDPSAGGGGGGGTQYTEGATDASITGTALLWEDAGDTLATVSSGSPLPVDVVSMSGGGDASAANQTTMIGHLDGVETTLSAIDTKLGTLDNAISGTEMQVDVVTSALPTGASTSAKQDTIIGHLDGVEGLLTTIDGDTGSAASSLTALQAALSAGGTELDVNIVSGSSSGTEYTEGDTDASITGTAILWEDAADTLRVPSASNPLPVDVVSMSGGGDASAANQTTMIGHLDGVEGLLTTIDGDTGSMAASLTAIEADALAASGTELDVNVIASALPSGAATAANQTTVIGHLDGVEGLLTTIDADTGGIATSVATVAGAVSGTEMQVDVVGALPAGTNNIGDVDIASIAAGDNNIGNVDIVTMPNVTLAAGTNTNEVVGDAAIDAAIAGNPVLAGGRASEAEPSAVSADNDVQALWLTRQGAQIVAGEREATATVSEVAISTTVATLAASSAARKGLIIFNDHATESLFVKFGSTATTDDFTLKIPAQAVYELPAMALYTGIVTGILSTGSGSARVTTL